MLDNAQAIETARGPRVDFHCPYDEAQLRQARVPGKHICPICWTYFNAPKDAADHA